MKYKTQNQPQKNIVRLQVALIGIALVYPAMFANARAVNEVPEPSMLSLMGLGLVVAIVAWRLRGKK